MKYLLTTNKKTKLIGVIFLVIVILTIVWVNLRFSLKHLLPRSGNVEIAGGVYTPFLLENSPLYFLKEWEEGIELFLNRSFTKKATLGLTFANKRLLEVESMTRSGDTSRLIVLMKTFSNDFHSAISLAEQALNNQENLEEFVWFFQESVQDQQIVFDLISNRISQPSKQEITDIQKSTLDAASNFLDKYYGLNLKEL